MKLLSLAAICLLPFVVLGQKCETSDTVVNSRKIKCKGELVFEDDFKFLDLIKWKRTVRFNGDDYDFVIYGDDPENSYVNDGKLIIKPTLLNDTFVTSGSLTLEGCTERVGSTDCLQEAKFFNILPPVRSAQYCTSQTFSFKYGTITIRAKLPSGDWVVPQLWLKPAANVYGERYMSGKVRIGSSRGNQDLKTSADKQIGNTLLEGGVLLATNAHNSQVRGRSAQFLYSEPWSSRAHNFTFIWKPDDLIFLVDGRSNQATTIIDNFNPNIVTSVGFSISDNPAWRKGSNIAPFDEEFYICLGVGVGGNFGFPDGSVSSGKLKPWENLKTKSLLTFWQNRDNWHPSWTDDTKLEVEHISVTAI